MSATVIRADARALPLADASVDLIVTSPPYWTLRSYTDGGQHYDGQIGCEPTPALYLAELIACTREWMRVLKPTGSIWVQLGDTYSGKPNATAAAPYKSLLLLPERYRIACVDQIGLTARAVVVGSKPNGLPESVTDRVRRSHEDWVHLTKQPRYFSAVDAIRDAYEPDSARRKVLYGNNPGRDGLAGLRATGAAKHGSNGVSVMGVGGSAMNPLGKLPGSVWEIPSEPLVLPAHLGLDHYASFATEWPRRIILGWSPSGYCTACDQGRGPVSAKGEYRMAGHGGNYAATPYGAGNHGTGASSLRTIADRVITGEVCACPDITAPTRPALVVDPFGGTGTTALVAHALGRHGITIDRSADYCRIATWRTNDPAQLAKAMRVPRPPVQADGQLDLFAEPGGTP